MKKLKINMVGAILMLLPLVFQPFGSIAQALSPDKVMKASGADISPPLRDIPPDLSANIDMEWIEEFLEKHPAGHPILFEKQGAPLPSVRAIDHGVQRFFGWRDSDTTLQNFDGTPNRSGIKPPDSDGDVGPDHYFSTVNSYFSIFSKTGELLYGPVSNRTIWNGFIGPWTYSHNGDPIVLYDENAGRWIFSQMALPTGSPLYYEMVAVSQTSDPLGVWNRYAFEFEWLPDYPKFGIWQDAYYLTLNQWDLMSYTYKGMGALALERDSMLAGSPGARMIHFSYIPPDNAQWMLPADCDGPFPPEGTPGYFMYLGDEPDVLYLFELAADWDDPGNSTFGETAILPVDPYIEGPFLPRIPQPETDYALNDLADRLMFRLQFRQFPDHAAMVCNHTVEVDSAHFGISWYELRNSDTSWSVFQQGTYAPDEACRWMGSIAMDEFGTIALGYSISSKEIFPSVCYTGRLEEDPPGIMTFEERVIFYGGGSQLCCNTGSSPWGDYSAMSVDPIQPGVFWYTQQYYPVSSNAWWKTRVGSFSFTGGGTSANPTNPQKKTRISVLPNPSADLFEISIEGLTEEEAVLSVVNPEGKPVILERFTGGSEHLHRTLSMGQYPDGMYLLIVQQKDRSDLVKLLKHR